MSNSWPMYTLVIMVVLFVLVVGIDVWLALNKKEGDTYSEVLRKAGKKWIAIIMITCFSMGTLAGHWWW